MSAILTDQGLVHEHYDAIQELEPCMLAAARTTGPLAAGCGWQLASKASAASGGKAGNKRIAAAIFRHIWHVQ
jgi:hypothetical protein